MRAKLSRREFLRKTVVGGVAISGVAGVGKAVATALEAVSSADTPKSRIVSATDSKVFTAGGEINQGVLQTMLGKSVAKLVGTKSGAAAWKKLFRPDDVVGIKVNCLFTKGACTHTDVTNAVVAGLLMAGVKPENIIIWDRGTSDLIKAGYIINKDGAGPRCYGVDGDWAGEYTFGEFKGRLAKILTERITALVNVPILKHHGMSGISCALKNHYGSIDDPSSCHGGGCNPYLGDLNAVGPIKEKTRLVVVDALRPFADGGPGFNSKTVWDYCTMLLSRDPVAVDYTGWRIIEEKRASLGLRALDQPGRWLATAGRNGVGLSDPDRIELLKV